MPKAHHFHSGVFFEALDGGSSCCDRPWTDFTSAVRH